MPNADKNRITNQVIALLNAGTRKLDGTPNYNSTVGDGGRASGEIATSVLNAAMEVARAVCETPGHAWMESFFEEVELQHASAIPFSYGATTVPKIQPFKNANFYLQGVRRSFDKISSYRINRNQIYSAVAHDASNGGAASKLAGFYDIVNGIFYFTGYAAFMNLASFSSDDVFGKLPDSAEPIITRMALGSSAKEGDVSDGLFAAWRQMGMNDLQQIRSGATVFSPVDNDIQNRGSQAR